jgi:iron complex transport system ATP-binding protein
VSIAVRDVIHRYKGAQMPALKGVNTAAIPGRITAVLGPNAAGKSTLLRCIIGALKPSGGSVLIDGEPSHLLKTKKLAGRLAYVPQRPQVAAAFTVREVIELGRYALPASRQRIDETLKRLELESIADRPFPSLSVGQQQRVTLGRAIAQLGPKGHLVLDEPTSAMDLRHAARTTTLLRELAGKGVTVVIAMHDLKVAASTADECWLLDAGRLVAAGPTAEVLQIDRLQGIFGVPFEWVDRPGGAPILHAGK